jgi:hypothetical protein
MLQIQIWLDPQDLLELEKLAEKFDSTISEVIKKLIREHPKESKHTNFRKAADLMENEYFMDSDLTEFSAINGESFLDEP